MLWEAESSPAREIPAASLLLFFIGGNPGRDVAGSLARTLLFGLSAGAFLVYERPASLAVVNNDWLSIGLGVAFCAQIAALHWERRTADRGGECDPGGGVQPDRISLVAHLSWEQTDAQAEGRRQAKPPKAPRKGRPPKR